MIGNYIFLISMRLIILPYCPHLHILNHYIVSSFGYLMMYNSYKNVERQKKNCKFT